MNTKRHEPTSPLRFLFFRRLVSVLLIVFSTQVLANPTTASIADETDPLQQLEAWLQIPVEQRPDFKEQTFSSATISKQQAEKARQLLWEDYCQQQRPVATRIIEEGVVTDGTNAMKFAAKIFGNKPEKGHRLFLSLHGGGGTTKRVNDGQWENQKRLYSPKEGIYVAPRAPTDTWNLWHQAHIDGLFRQIIQAYVVTGQVDPDRVYVMGYSAGGDGVYQLAPRMADSFAAAAMMAGHPNEASPLGLRNIGFTIHMGGNDAAYNRNQVAKQWGQKLDELQQEDPKGYPHKTVIHEGKGHWMDREDAVALDFMAPFDRNPNPDKIVWFQDDVTRDRFYWLAISPDQQRAGVTVTAVAQNQTIVVETTDLDRITVRLSDDLVDLDQPINFVVNGKEVSRTVVPRKIGNLLECLLHTGDPNLIWSAQHDLQIPQNSTETPAKDDGPK